MSPIIAPIAQEWFFWIKIGAVAILLTTYVFAGMRAYYRDKGLSNYQRDQQRPR